MSLLSCLPWPMMWGGITWLVTVKACTYLVGPRLCKTGDGVFCRVKALEMGVPPQEMGVLVVFEETCCLC